MLSRIISALEKALFPPRCLLNAGSATQVDLADHLVAQLKPVLATQHCPRCAVNTAENYLCAACLHHPPAFDQVIAAFWLDDTLKQLMHRMKYGKRPDIRITRLLSTLALSQLKQWPAEAEALIPIPLHSKRLQARGFNQAAWLAKDWGKALALPVIPLLTRQTDTPHQAKLNARERRHNIQQAFGCSQASLLHELQCVALVDDVLTTGATAHAAAQCLKQYAPHLNVEIWGVARTPLL